MADSTHIHIDDDLIIGVCCAMRVIVCSDDAVKWANWLLHGFTEEWRWYRTAEIYTVVPGYSSQYAWAKVMLQEAAERHVLGEAIEAIHRAANAEMYRAQVRIDKLGGNRG